MKSVFRSPKKQDVLAEGANNSQRVFSTANKPFDEAMNARITKIVSDIRNLKEGDLDGLKAQVRLLEAEFKTIASTNQKLILDGASQNFKTSILEWGLSELRLQIIGPAEGYTIADLEFNTGHGGHIMLAGVTLEIKFYLVDAAFESEFFGIALKNIPTTNLSIEASSNNLLIGACYDTHLFSKKKGKAMGEGEAKATDLLMKIADAISSYSPEKAARQE